MWWEERTVALFSVKETSLHYTLFRRLIALNDTKTVNIFHQTIIFSKCSQRSKSANTNCAQLTHVLQKNIDDFYGEKV
jgi:hypothetical protein